MVQNAVAQLRELFAEQADPDKSASMKAYMKGKFDYFGISSPERKTIQREWFMTIKGLDTWDVVYMLWNQPERELQYVAADLLKKLPLKAYDADDYKKLEELITTKSWWDTTDGIASNNVGRYFQAHPDMIEKVIKRWRQSDDMWLNRTTLIFQLKYKEETDFELTKDLIIQFLPVKEFFIQKAIGWALRQYSKSNPDAVREFIETLELSTVAKREAWKYIN
jgi:3-methyladenine DNA glycosylase AlkD